MGSQCMRKELNTGDEEDISFMHPDDLDSQGYDDSVIVLESKTEYDFTNFNSATLRGAWSPTEPMNSDRNLLAGDLLKTETFRSYGINRRPTLSYVSSLSQTVQFRIGNELLCMTWNIHNDNEATPFDYYCDFRAIGLKERHSVMIEIIWDVARVFLSTSNPTDLCKGTQLSEILPPFLLNAFEGFSIAAKIPEKEREQVISFPNASIFEFLTSHFYDGSTDKVLQNQCSFIQLHRKNRERKTSPLRLNYDPLEYNRLLKADPTILPLLILDFLHVLVIKFSAFLVESQLRKAFSEFQSENQIGQLVAYSKQCKERIKLDLPKQFLNSRKRLYSKWKLVFKERNKIKQVSKKASETKTDIILLQQVTQAAYKELVGQMSVTFDILPKEYPDSQKETTVICLRKSTVQAKKDTKIKYLNERNFVLLCVSSDILFYVGVVNLTPGESCGEFRKKEALRLMRALGKNTPVIVGGNFNEDLTASDNPVAKIMLEKYNGIDHTQDEPLVFSVNRTRTTLQFEVAKSDEQDKGVNDGIFSSFPLVGEAFTNFIQTGMDNPSDHGPVFQRIMLGLF